MPACNAFAERMVRTFRENALDHMIIYNENDLYEILKEYVEYYNKKRTHSSLDFNSPLTKFLRNELFHPEKIKREKILDGLITNFSLAA